jgi:hypothetical protein
MVLHPATGASPFGATAFGASSAAASPFGSTPAFGANPGGLFGAAPARTSVFGPAQPQALSLATQVGRQASRQLSALERDSGFSCCCLCTGWVLPSALVARSTFCKLTARCSMLRYTHHSSSSTLPHLCQTHRHHTPSHATMPLRPPACSALTCPPAPYPRWPPPA